MFAQPFNTVGGFRAAPATTVGGAFAQPFNTVGGFRTAAPIATTVGGFSAAPIATETIIGGNRVIGGGAVEIDQVNAFGQVV
jgi:hypothetical protein